MVTVYAILDVAVLAIGAGVQAGEQGYGVDLVLGRGVFVLEAALVALGAGPAEEVVVAELVAVLTLLNRLERGRVDRDRAVQATGAGVPGRLGGGRGRGFEATARADTPALLRFRGSVTCGGGLAFCVIVAYEMPPAAMGPETIKGVKEAELIDLGTSLSPRNISFRRKILAPVDSISRTVG